MKNRLALLFSLALALVPAEANAFRVGGLIWPSGDGAANQCLKSDGAGNLGWRDAAFPFSVSSPLAYSSNVVSMSQSSGSANGWLSSVDWTTFNSKQGAGNYVTGLTGDVSATGPGSASATVNSVAGSTAANVHAAELAANAATNANTASTTVKRDGTGSFSAGTVTGTFVGNITGALTGNASGTASNITGTAAIANGGTGQTSKTAAFDALSPNAALGGVTYHNGTNNVTLSGNTTATKTFLTQTGNGSVSAAPGWNTIAAGDVPTLNQNTTGTASNVTGTVAIANGGTGATAKAGAFDALSPMSASGDLIYGSTSGTGTRLPKGANGQVLTLASGLPSWAAPAAAPAVPTVSVATTTSHSGGFSANAAGTYTTPASVRWVRVRMVGGGGGGAGSGTSSSGGTGSNGNASTFGSSLLTAGGGVGNSNVGNGAGGGGGSVTVNSPAVDAGSSAGGHGGRGVALTAVAWTMGGYGAGTPFSFNSNGDAANPNTGVGGFGASSNGTASQIGSGGGAGGFIQAIITSPSSTYSYTVGTGGGAGAAGTNGNGGGVGSDGIVIVEEYY